MPEGYKTGGTSAFKIWTDNSTINTVTRPPTTTSIRASSRELLPFCGINRIGGLDVQSFAPDEEDDLPILDDVPELTFSQESTDSNTSEPSRKRIFDEEEGDGALLAVAEELGNRRSYSPAGWGDSRVKAVPRSRVRKDGGLPTLDREDFKMHDDFEEAGFLVFGDHQRMDIS